MAESIEFDHSHLSNSTSGGTTSSPKLNSNYAHSQNQEIGTDPPNAKSALVDSARSSIGGHAMTKLKVPKRAHPRIGMGCRTRARFVFKRKDNTPSQAPRLPLVHRHAHTTGLQIPKAEFAKFAREIAKQEFDVKLEYSATEALQEVAEMLMIMFFEYANQNATEKQRITIHEPDMIFARKMMKSQRLWD